MSRSTPGRRLHLHHRRRPLPQRSGIPRSRRFPPLTPPRIRSIAGWAIATQVSIGLYAVVRLVTIVTSFAYLGAITDWEQGHGSFEQIVAAETDYILASPFELLLLIAAGLTTMTWLYRAAKNTDTFGYTRLDHAPKWAIWGWVIPILALFRPYQMMTQTWIASAPPSDTFRPTPWIQPWWWGLFVLSFLLDTIGGFGGDVTSSQWTADSARLALQLGSTAAAVDIAAAPLFIFLVRALTQRQQASINEFQPSTDLSTFGLNF